MSAKDDLRASRPRPQPPPGTYQPADWQRFQAHFGWSPRELEIAQLLLFEGLPQKVIARRLGIKLATLKTEVHHLYEKTGIHGHGELGSKLLEAYRSFHRDIGGSTPPLS